ncbi:ubiquitin carboxyl-terminal hydrolase [Salix suchowensis]|nr:ubiquitin carboxyl-terminal hydrolase [Salix suchowensis]
MFFHFDAFAVIEYISYAAGFFFDEFQGSEGGLFVDVTTCLAFQTRKVVPEDRPLKKPTHLAIGVDGGFDNNEPEYEETHNTVILPDYVTLPFPSVELPEKCIVVRSAVDAIIMTEVLRGKSNWITD